MKLHVLGMNGPYPAPGGACSGYLVTEGDDRIALDLGSGTLAALTALTAPEELTALCFSHWHFDHCSDFLPLVYRLADAAAAGCAPLDVYGPADGSSDVRRIAEKLPTVRLHTVSAGETFAAGKVAVRVFAARHPVPAVMYRLEGAGRALCYTGDTNTIDSLRPFAHGASLLLADGLFPEAAWTAEKPHLSARLAAETAREAHAEQLVITHLNPRFAPGTLLAEARTAYPRVKLARRGDVYDV